MLILQRKVGESIQIGEDILVSISSVEKGRVRVAIDAPSDIPIMRTELLEAKKANQEAALAQDSASEILELLTSVKKKDK